MLSSAVTSPTTNSPLVFHATSGKNVRNCAGSAPNFIGTQYDVSADGRFLINSVPSNYSSASP